MRPTSCHHPGVATQVLPIKKSRNKRDRSPLIKVNQNGLDYSQLAKRMSLGWVIHNRLDEWVRIVEETGVRQDKTEHLLRKRNTLNYYLITCELPRYAVLLANY